MIQLEIIYWRDIPAQCVLRVGRKKHGVALPERFEQAIDRCAMKTGLKESDDYLAQWRRAPGEEWRGSEDIPTALKEARALLEQLYPNERLHKLIEQQGFEASEDKETS